MKGSGLDSKPHLMICSLCEEGEPCLPHVLQAPSVTGIKGPYIVRKG